MKKLIAVSWIVVAPVLLLAWYAMARERFVPHNADPARAAWRLTGDEPAYLLTAQAIALGHGQDLRAANEARTYTNFQSRPVIGPTQWTYDYYRSLGVKTWSDRREAWGSRQTLHRPPLVSLVLAPIALRESGVRWAACLMLAALAAAAAAVLVGLQPAPRRPLAALAAVVMLGSLPAACYTCQIYPETVTGVCLLLALALNASGGRVAAWVGCALLTIAPWGTARALPAAAGAALVYAACAARRRRWSTIAILAAGFGAYFAYNLWLWGALTPPNVDPTSQLALSAVPRGLLASFVSRSVGLWFLAPATFAAGVALVALLCQRRRDADAWAAALALGGTVLLVAAFPSYRAGMCAAGRYQVIPAYVLLFAVVLWFARGTGPWRGRILASFIALGAVSLVLSALVLRRPDCWFEPYLPVFKYAAINRFYGLLPNIHQGYDVVRLLAWAALLALTLGLWDAGRFFRQRAAGRR